MDDVLPTLLAFGSDGRLLAGAIGVVLLLIGARLYSLAVMAPGFLLGVFATALALDEYGRKFDELMRLGILVVAGSIGAFISTRIEQLAVRLCGSLVVAATTHAILPLVWPKAPWFAAPAAGFVGLLLFPSLYRRLLPLITSAVGAIAIAWAASAETNLLLISGLTVLGAAIQLGTGGRSRKSE
ncbi:MAG: hypothetical protein CL927_09805 [Deltaproteobacteria bacterium]|nr:hypothetical protein [Deltaproteobacteria bacterium]HCH63565.1 hypothetical protein [Deltaproteobacteria bacterium]